MIVGMLHHSWLSRRSFAVFAMGIAIVGLCSAPQNAQALETQSHTDRIINGTPAAWPEYFVKVSPGNYLCGGSLINSQWVLTAGHCAIDNAFHAPYDPSEVTVTLHKNNVSTIRAVSQVIVNPGFQPLSHLINHDVALLKLASPATGYQTIDLSSTAMTVGTSVTVIGLGSTSTDPNNPVLPNSPYSISVPVLSQNACTNAYDYQVRDNMVCMGDALTASQGNIHDACQGDSGGPAYTVTNNVATQVAVVSWGYGCAQADQPGVYSRISSHYAWITECVNSNGSCEGFVACWDLNANSDCDTSEDTNHDEICDEYDCYLANTLTQLTDTAPIAVGDSTCPGGGYTLSTGLDANHNHVLDSNEVNSTVHLCNGATGATGPAGADGQNGTNGSSGTNGTNGTNGAGGSSGSSGKSGCSTASGAGYLLVYMMIAVRLWNRRGVKL